MLIYWVTSHCLGVRNLALLPSLTSPFHSAQRWPWGCTQAPVCLVISADPPLGPSPALLTPAFAWLTHSGAQLQALPSAAFPVIHCHATPPFFFPAQDKFTAV